MAWGDGQKYGRWEGRVKAPVGDRSYNALLLLWPDAENWPVGGEVDFMEMSDHTRQSTDMFLHYGRSNSQLHGEVKIDATEWHNWAVEWAPDHITAFVDGKQWFHTDKKEALPPGPMHLCIQLDWFPKSGAAVQTSHMYVDWVRQYPLTTRDTGRVLTVSGADLVWTGAAEIPGGVVRCAGGRVVDEDGPGEVLDASGCVVTPGLVNAHHHLLQTAFRTLPGTRGVPMREWLPRMAAAYAAVGVDAELARTAAAAGLAEALLCGVTTVADHHLTWPSGDGVDLATAVADAAAELGARLVFVRGSARDDPEQAAASAEAIASALGGDETGMVQVAVGPAGVHSDSERTFALLGEVAARHGLRRRTQAGEQVRRRGRRRALRATATRAARRVGLDRVGRDPGPPVRRHRAGDRGGGGGGRERDPCPRL